MIDEPKDDEEEPTVDDTVATRDEEGELTLTVGGRTFGMYADRTILEYAHGPEKNPVRRTEVEFRTIRVDAEPGGNGWGNQSYTFDLKLNSYETGETYTTTYDIEELSFPSPRPTPEQIRIAGKMLERYAEVTDCQYTNSVWEETYKPNQ